MASYYIRQGTFAPQGPFEEARIAGYIAQGKVRAGMEISADGQRWMPVEEHRLFTAAAPPVRAVATPPPVRAVQPVEEVEEVEVIGEVPEEPARPRRQGRRVQRTAATPPSGEMTPEQKGGAGCLALLVIIGIGYFMTKGSDDPGSGAASIASTSEVTVTGSVARTTVRLSTLDDADSAARKLASPVYRIAKQYPSVQTIELRVVFSKEGLVDQYGNALSGDADLGIDEVKADEVVRARKFVDEPYYIRDDQVQIHAAVWLMTSLGEYKKFIDGVK